MDERTLREAVAFLMENGFSLFHDPGDALIDLIPILTTDDVLLIVKGYYEFETHQNVESQDIRRYFTQTTRTDA